MLIQLIEGVYRLLWGDLLTLHLGNVTLSLSFMVILLLTAGVFFTLRTRLLPPCRPDPASRRKHRSQHWSLFRR